MDREERTCIFCGWTCIPTQTIDQGSGLEWSCPRCQTWQHADPYLLAQADDNQGDDQTNEDQAGREPGAGHSATSRS
jgi:hypothetical protein